MMNNLDKYKSLLGDAVDGLLLTSGTAAIMRRSSTSPRAWLWSPGRAAGTLRTAATLEIRRAHLRGFEVLPVDREHSYAARINRRAGLWRRTLGFEEGYLTVAEFRIIKRKLTAELKPCQAAIHGFEYKKNPGSCA